MRLIGAAIFLFVPFILLARFLPLLAVLVPLVFLAAFVKVYLQVWAEKRQKRRWPLFTVDQEYWASAYPDQLRDGAIKLDLTRRWVVFHLHPCQPPRCFTAASIRSCRLIEGNRIEMMVRGEAAPYTAYPEAKDAKRIVEEIERLRCSPTKLAPPRMSEVSSP